MPRVKAGTVTRARHKKVLKRAKGFQGARSRQFQKAKEAVTKAECYAYRDRRNKKREFRALWIARINAAVREQGLTYSQLIGGLTKAHVEVDRKIMADLAMNAPESFTALVAISKESLSASA